MPEGKLVPLADIVAALHKRADDRLADPAYLNGGLRDQARDRADAELIRADAYFIARTFGGDDDSA